MEVGNMNVSPRSESHAPSELSVPQASLESILCTEELHRRPWRLADYEKENCALVALVSVLADSPRTIFQTLAETILDVTQCDSAGLSLLTRDGKTPDVSGKRFYWPAIAGMWNPHVGGGTPRNFGPCGDVLDQDRTLLFRHFERRYPYLLPVIPAAEECLLVPFHVHNKAVGTVWAIMHSDRRKFDAEDDRVMNSLAKFASSAYQALVSIDKLEFQVAKREKAEAQLRKLTDSLGEQVRARTADLQRSEERLRLAQQAARIGTFEWNLQTGVSTWTSELEAMYGLPVGGFGGTQTAFENLVHPEERQMVHALIVGSLETGQSTKGEWRVIWPDGSVHWLAGGWQIFMNESGKPSRMIGFNTDVTERKLAEQERFELSGRLINAQEQERKHLARELHDDFSQRLALMSVELERIAAMIENSQTGASRRIRELHEVVNQVGKDLHAVSHRLHSSKLEILGLASAVASHCREVSKQHDEIHIDFDHKNVPPSIKPDTALCLLRIVQEGLSNVITHSRASKVEVRLKGNHEAISLVLCDNGVGFELSKNYGSNGIGIQSMKERARMLGGTFDIQSRPMQGTQIAVNVPLINTSAAA
jgi:PAS domain S-box-containing protein